MKKQDYIIPSCDTFECELEGVVLTFSNDQFTEDLFRDDEFILD